MRCLFHILYIFSLCCCAPLYTVVCARSSYISQNLFCLFSRDVRTSTVCTYITYEKCRNVRLRVCATTLTLIYRKRVAPVVLCSYAHQTNTVQYPRVYIVHKHTFFCLCREYLQNIQNNYILIHIPCIVHKLFVYPCTHTIHTNTNTVYNTLTRPL